MTLMPIAEVFTATKYYVILVILSGYPFWQCLVFQLVTNNMTLLSIRQSVLKIKRFLELWEYFSTLQFKVQFRFEPFPYCLNSELDFWFSSAILLNFEPNFGFSSGWFRFEPKFKTKLWHHYIRWMSGFVRCHFMIEFVDGSYGYFSTTNSMLIGLISPELRHYGDGISTSVMFLDVVTIPIRCPLLSSQYSAECQSFEYWCICGASMNNLRTDLKDLA